MVGRAGCAQPSSPPTPQSGRIYSRRCSMMLSMVGLKRAFMASGLILSMPCEDHFTKSTLWGCHRDKCVKAGLSPGPPTGSLDPSRHNLGAQRGKCPIFSRPEHQYSEYQKWKLVCFSALWLPQKEEPKLRTKRKRAVVACPLSPRSCSEASWRFHTGLTCGFLLLL